MINTTWSSFEQYLLMDRKVSKSNISSYKSQFKYIDSFFKGKEFTRENINSFFGYLSDNKKSFSTLNNYIKCIKHLNRLLGKNELEDFKYFPKEYEKQRLLTQEEVNRIIEAPVEVKSKYGKSTYSPKVQERYSTLIYFLSVTGCRIGETVDLKWEDVTQDTVTIRAENAKNSKERQIPINQTTYERLLKLKRYPHNYVFGGSKGRLDEWTVNKTLRLKAKSAGIKDIDNIHCHLLRHFFATEKIKTNPIDRVSKILGHANVGITASVYGHYDMSMLRSVVEDKVPTTKETTKTPDLIEINRKLDLIINALGLDTKTKVIRQIKN
jgi:integrase